MTGNIMSDKAIEALRLLVAVKDHKDKIGKDLFYNIGKNIAWRKAREALKEIDNEQTRTIRNSN